MTPRDPLSAQRVPARYFRGAVNGCYRLPDPVPWPAGAIASLPEREQAVLTHRLDLDGGGRRTLAVGRALGVTGSRVAQIEARAMRRLWAGPLASWDRWLLPMWRRHTRAPHTEHPWWLLP